MLSKTRRPLKHRSQPKRSDLGIVYGGRIDPKESTSYAIPVNNEYDTQSNFIIITKEINSKILLTQYEGLHDIEEHMKSMNINNISNILCVITIISNLLDSQIYPMVDSDDIIIGGATLSKDKLKTGLVNSISYLSRLVIGTNFSHKGKLLNVKHEVACSIMDDVMNHVIGENNVIFNPDH
jgi:hypothetical protein